MATKHIYTQFYYQTSIKTLLKQIIYSEIITIFV